jgi:hypothetical protein
VLLSKRARQRSLSTKDFASYRSLFTKLVKRLLALQKRKSLVKRLLVKDFEV